MPTFDPIVFDSGTFDASYGTPALHKVQVDPTHRKVISGTIVIITAYIVTITDPRRKFLFNPESGVRFHLFYPDGSIKISNAPMSNLDIGIYQYRHQTGVLADDTVFDSNVFDTINVDPLGVYTGYFTARDGNVSMKTIPQEFYTLIEG